MEANRGLLVLLRSSQLGNSSEKSGGIEASNFLKIMLICVLKKSSLLILCLETMLPSKSQILQMIIKSPISRWIRIDRGTGALLGVVQVLEAHSFEDEVQPTVLF